MKRVGPGAFLCALLISACNTTPVPSLAQPDDNNRIEPLSYLTLKRQFHQQLKDFENANDPVTLKRALASGERFIALQPHQDEEVAKVYRLKMLDYLTAPGVSKMQSLEDFYLDHRSLRYFDLASPSFLKVMASMEGIVATSASIEQLRTWLKQAVQENPGFARVKEMLSALYIEADQAELAAFLTAQLAKSQPQNESYLKTHANAQWNLSFQKMCTPVSVETTEVAIEAQRKLLSLSPHDQEIQADLASLYQLAGRNRLMEFTLKQIAAQDATYNAQYAEALIWRGKPDQAATYFYDADYQQQNSDWYYAAVYQALMTQQWQQASLLAQQIENDPQPSVYAIVYVAQMLEREQGKQVAQHFLAANQDKYEGNDWKDSLFDYAHQKLTQEQLLAAADDKCKQTEAYFMLALQSLVRGDETGWLQHTLQSASYKVFGFYEYATADYWISQSQ